MMRIDRLKLFQDFMISGAWPFLVGGVICLVNSVNERDLVLLTMSSVIVVVSRCGAHSLHSLRSLRVGGRRKWPTKSITLSLPDFLEGLSVTNRRKVEAITGL